MNTDKIFAEAIANEYAPKDTSKVAALRKEVEMIADIIESCVRPRGGSHEN